MKFEITVTENREQLQENLEKRAENIEKIDENKIEVETEKEATIAKTPGIDTYQIEGEEKKKNGLKGRPVQERAYARLETRKDAVKALLATINGYNLVILDSSREWDLRQLRKYNPDIIELKSDETVKELGVEKSLFEDEETEKIQVPMEEVDVDQVYREMLT